MFGLGCFIRLAYKIEIGVYSAGGPSFDQQHRRVDLDASVITWRAAGMVSGSGLQVVPAINEEQED